MNRIQAYVWFIASLFISSICDIIMKYLTYDMPLVQIAFLRYFWGTVTLLPLVYQQGFYTKNYRLHITRGLLLACAGIIWVVGLTETPVATATLMTFLIPFFILFLAPIFLKETLEKEILAVTIVGFIGVAIVINPSYQAMHLKTFLLLISVFLFAVLDIINKFFLKQETMLAMLFYSSFFAMLFTGPVAMYNWSSFGLSVVLLTMILGALGNLILYCILKAFSAVKASDLAPYRYLEIIISMAFAYTIFNETPQSSYYLGAAIIIPSTLYAAYHQNRKNL